MSYGPFRDRIVWGKASPANVTRQSFHTVFPPHGHTVAKLGTGEYQGVSLRAPFTFGARATYADALHDVYAIAAHDATVGALAKLREV